MTKVMFEKWQHEREHQKLSWLRCERERDKRHLVSLHSAVCKKYERSIESLKNFSMVCITGLANQTVSDVLGHTTSNIHKVAMARDFERIA